MNELVPERAPRRAQRVVPTHAVEEQQQVVGHGRAACEPVTHRREVLRHGVAAAARRRPVEADPRAVGLVVVEWVPVRGRRLLTHGAGP